MNKEKICDAIISTLQATLTTAIASANNAHLDATDDQSVAETQYDTLAIEASYLAEGQSRRVEELKAAIENMQQLRHSLSNKANDEVTLGSLVALSPEQENIADRWFFIAPCAAGLSLQVDEITFTVITPKSPLGQQLIGAYLDDEIKFPHTKQTNHSIISQVY